MGELRKEAGLQLHFGPLRNSAQANLNWRRLKSLALSTEGLLKSGVVGDFWCSLNFRND
jgi:hypothetical protein